MEENHKEKSWLFDKINKTNKPVTSLVKKKREKTQITNIGDKRENTSANPTNSESKIKNVMNNFVPINLTTQMKMDKFPERHMKAKLNARRNRKTEEPTSIKQFEYITKYLSPRPRWPL